MGIPSTESLVFGSTDGGVSGDGVPGGGVSGGGVSGGGVSGGGVAGWSVAGCGLGTTGLMGVMRCIRCPPLPGGMGSTDPAETPIPYPGEPGPGTKCLRRTSPDAWSDVPSCLSLSINLINL